MNCSGRRKAWSLGYWKVSKRFAFLACSAFIPNLIRETSHLAILDPIRGDYGYFHKTNAQIAFNDYS